MKALFRCLFALALWFAWCIKLPSAVTAQASRTEVIAQKQTAKAEKLGVEEPSTLEKIVVWAEVIYPGTGIGIGGGYVRRWSHHRHVNLAAGIGLKSSAFVEMDIIVLRLASNWFDLELKARQTAVRDIYFYGLGAQSGLGSLIHYDYRPT